MGKEKRIYLKPQMSVMNIQTEGVIAASGDSGTVDYNTFCGSSCLSKSGACNCFGGKKAIASCEQIDGAGINYSTTFKCNIKTGEDYNPWRKVHFVLLANGQISYWPCDKN